MKPSYGVAPRNLMERLLPGIGERPQQGVRRRPLVKRSPDQPTQAIQARAEHERPAHSVDLSPTLKIESISFPEPQRQPALESAWAMRPKQPQALPSDATVYIAAIPDKPAAVCAVLVGIQGPLEGEVYKIHDGANKLGRGDDCDAVLESVRISRFHARIHHEDGAFVVEANAEVVQNNPTLVNGSEIDAEGLFDGDVLTLGDSSFAFRTISRRRPAA